MVKDGNQDVIAILNNYKKTTNSKEMSTELRKYLRKKGEKENEKVPQCQSPKSNNNQKLFQQQPQQFPNSQKKSCPDLWKSGDTSSPKIINLAKAKELTNDVQLSEIILSDRNQNESKDIEKTQFYTTNTQQYIQQLQPTFDRSERDTSTIQQDSEIQYSQNQQFLEKDIDINERNDDYQSESSNESILKQITEPPLQLIQDQTTKNDLKPTQLFSSRNSSYLQINIAQSYLQSALTQQQDLQQNVKQSVEQQSQEKILVIDPQKNYSFFNYQDCQILAQPQYKHVFTNWSTLLHKLDKPEYIPNYKSVLYIDTTPEYLFSLLFPNSAYIKINYFSFQNQLKQTPLQIDIDELFKVLFIHYEYQDIYYPYELYAKVSFIHFKQSLNYFYSLVCCIKIIIAHITTKYISIFCIYNNYILTQNSFFIVKIKNKCQHLDNQFFLLTILDKDGDDWINYRETGLILESICLQQEQPRNFIRELFESLKQTQSSSNAITLIDLQQLERTYQFQFARQLMQEADIYQNGNLTYWDLFMHKDIYLMQKLCELVIQYEYNKQEQQQ